MVHMSKLGLVQTTDLIPWILNTTNRKTILICYLFITLFPSSILLRMLAYVHLYLFQVLYFRSLSCFFSAFPNKILGAVHLEVRFEHVTLVVLPNVFAIFCFLLDGTQYFVIFFNIIFIIYLQFLFLLSPSSNTSLDNHGIPGFLDRSARFGL